VTVGGYIISNERVAIPVEGKEHPKFVRRLWCRDRYGDEIAVYAEPSAEVLELGENIWWQSGTIYARDDKLPFHKIGNSFQPPGEAVLGTTDGHAAGGRGPNPIEGDGK
jgi:hypothetical protein